MYSVTVKTSFEAAHRLENYDGPCSILHGHHWVIRATWCRKTLDNVGMAFDMIKLKKLLRYATSDLEHHFLNKVLPKPTSENIAGLLFERLKVKDYGTELRAVVVEETPGCCAMYTEEE